jgi:type VI secretion system secreted protein Hcp
VAFDCFIKIDGIPGESTDHKHRDWIEVLSFSHAVSQPGSGSRSSGGARSAERCDHEDFSVVHTLDKASPKLALFCCRGDHIKTIKIEVCRATGDKQKYLEYDLYDAIVSSVRPAGAVKGAETLPLEVVCFNYGKILVEYRMTDHKDGHMHGPSTAYWDLVQNRGG